MTNQIAQKPKGGRHIATRMLMVLVLSYFSCKLPLYNTAAKLFADTDWYGSFDRTYFMTVLHRCASHKVRQLVIQDFGSVFN